MPCLRRSRSSDATTAAGSTDEVEGDAAGPSAAQQLREAREVGRGLRHDELPAPVDPQALLRAVLRELSVAVAREARLQTVGCVVEACVQHAAVAAARVQAAAGLLLDQGDAAVGVPPFELERESDADDAAAHDQEIGTTREARIPPPPCGTHQLDGAAQASTSSGASGCSWKSRCRACTL